MTGGGRPRRGVSAPEILETTLSERDIPFQRLGHDVFIASLAGERKMTIPVAIFIRDRTLVVESFFMRRPAENHEGVYRMLLARNVRARLIHFALGDHDDVYLVAVLPLEFVTEEILDALLGELLTTADEMFDAAIAIGFESYLARDLAWRAKQG